MLTAIENEDLKITADSDGAQLQSLIFKKDGKNYLWHGDSKYWGRRAPVLFPIVGRLKDDRYFYDEKEYKMTQHGFARDMEFELSESSDKHLLYSLNYNQETLKIYPFKFKLEIKYELENNKLNISYRIFNEDKKEMYYSIGAHPAFYWPFKKGEKKEDYYLEFEKEENAARYLLDGGLLNNQKELVLDKEKKLELYPGLFKDDALVFKNISSDKVALKSKKSSREVELEFKDFPYLGIWSQSAEAPFICIEPWQGISDSTDSSGRLEEKEGINALKAGESDYFKHSIKIK